MNNLGQGFYAILIIFAEAAIAGGGAVGKLSLQQMDPFSFGLFRALAGSISIFLVSAFSGQTVEIWKIDHNYLPLVLLSVLFFVMGNTLYIGALKYGDLSTIFPIARSSPLFVFPLAVIFLQERITIPLILGTPLILLGVVIVSGVWQGKRVQHSHPINQGAVMALGISIVDAGLVVASKAAIRGVAPNTLAFTQAGASTLVFFGLSVLFKRMKNLKKTIFLAGISGLLSWGVGNVLYLFALRHVSAILAALLGGMGILYSAIFGTLFFKEKLERVHFLGAALILVGVTLASIRRV